MSVWAFPSRIEPFQKAFIESTRGDVFVITEGVGDDGDWWLIEAVSELEAFTSVGCLGSFKNNPTWF